MKKRICFIVSTLYSLGGIQRVVTIIANKLSEEGYDVHVICTDDAYKFDKTIYGLSDNIKNNFITTSKIEKYLCFWGYILKKIIIKHPFLQQKTKLVSVCYYKRKFIQNKKIVEYINTNKIDDVIAIGADYTMLLCLLKNKINAKIIGWQHSSCESYFEKDLNYRSLKYLFKEKMNLLDNYVVLTNSDCNWIKENFDYNAICIYNPKGFESEVKSNLKSKNFITVGRYDKVKGYSRLIDSFNIFSKKNKDWKLNIVGEGELKEELEKQIISLNLTDRVTLVPKTNKIIDYYLNSSIYLLSSYHEGLPMVLIEACECGLPIITYDLDCCVEQFSECSIIVPNGNINEFAKAMENLIEDKSLMNDLSNKAKRNAKNYNIENIIKQWQEIL